MKKIALLVVALAFLAGCANNTTATATATDVSGNATVTANVTANVK